VGVAGLSRRQRFLKRGLDIILSILGLALLWWMILLGWIIAAIDTRQNGMFTQARIGKDGVPFQIWKLRTMREDPYLNTSVTTQSDPRITRSGAFLRRTKWNELPQLFNVLMGHMSFVGPRPEVPGFADQLEGDDAIILSVRPGITGSATLRFRNEEIVLDSVLDPDAYNIGVLYPEKVQLNREYVENFSVGRDISLIFMTVFAFVEVGWVQRWIDGGVEPITVRQPEIIINLETETPQYAETA
jgi:lipopolysaccharide/colanic/teichoic acid biosynthesis glycosyltransferase